MKNKRMPVYVNTVSQTQGTRNYNSSHTSELIELLALQSIYFTTFDLLMYPCLIQVDIWVKVHLAVFNVLYTLPSTQRS